MKRLIQLPRFNEINPMPVMTHVFDELTDAFKDYNFTINIVKSINNLEDGGIIFLDNSGGNYIYNKDIYIQIAEKCPNSVFICWYWKDLSFQPFKYIIYTGEYYMNKDIQTEHTEYMLHPKFVPLKLRANDSPEMIGNYNRNIKRDYCFMGGGYKMDWVPSDLSGIYHRVIWDNYLSYNERRDIYLSSIFAFAFQSDENIRTGHLSQRIFEGLAYGCITLCENKLATDYTGGAVIYISSKEDLLNKILFYKKHPELIVKKQQEGYDWIKKYGTNRISIKLFLDKIKEIYNIEFDQFKEEKHYTYKMYETLIDGVKGHIDHKKLNSNNSAYISGWVFSERNGVCPTRIRYDGTIKSVDIETRSDICDKFNRKNIILCGWKAEVPINKYIDIQIKINSEWSTFISLNTFNLKQDEVQTVNNKEKEEPKNEIIQPNDNSVETLDKFIADAINDFKKKNPNANIKEPSIIKYNLALNQIHIPSYTVIDNFYNNPIDVRNFGLTTITKNNEYSNSKMNLQYYKQVFESMLGYKIDNLDKYKNNGQFICNISNDPISINTQDNQYGAIVFLTQNASFNTGITLYSSKQTNKMTIEESEKTTIFKSGEQNTTEFETVDIIGNIFNRVVIFNTKIFHSISHNFGNNVNDGRLIQIFYFDLEKPTSEPSTTKISFNM